MIKPTKWELLEFYSTREPKLFVQFDAFGSSDDFGDTFYGLTFELMRGSAVRVLIEPDTPKDDVLKMLDRIRESIAGLPDLDPKSLGGFSERDARDNPKGDCTPHSWPPRTRQCFPLCSHCLEPLTATDLEAWEDYDAAQMDYSRDSEWCIKCNALLEDRLGKNGEDKPDEDLPF